MQWNKLVALLQDIIKTDNADFEDYEGYILGVLKSKNQRCYSDAINCFIKAENLPQINPEKMKSLYIKIEPIIETLGIKYFDNTNTNNIDREFYLKSRFLLFLKSKKNIDALNTLTELINEFGKSQYYFQRSKIYAMQNKFKESLNDLNFAIKINPSNANYYYHRAILNHKLHQDSGSLIDLGSAINIDKENAEYYFFRGTVSLAMQKYKNAEEDFKKALQLSPNEARIYQQLASCKQKQNNFDEAITFIDKAIERDKSDPSNYFIRGIIYNQSKKYKEAIADFDNALKTDNESDKRWSAKVWYQKAWAEFKTEQYKEAQKNIAKALSYDNRILAYYYLAMDVEIFGTKNYYNARGFCSQILRKDPTNKRALKAKEKIIELEI